MGYHNVQLPTQFSEGSLFGPGFATRIIELDSMAEHRIPHGPDVGRRNYSLEQGINGLDALKTLHDFFIARGGAENSFRLKDWLDYATTATGTTHRGNDAAVSYQDVDLVLTDDAPDDKGPYQFVKRITSGPTTKTRRIWKLVSGTIKVGDHGGFAGAPRDLTGGATIGYTEDLENGQVTFASSPTGQVTGGCEFDVVARFADDTDKNFRVAIRAVDTGDLPAINCIEDVDPVPVSQDVPRGGAINHGDIGANYNLSELEGRQQTFAPSVARDLILPDTTDFPTGGPYFAIANTGTQTLTVKDFGGATITTIIAGAAKELWLGVDGAGVSTWYAF